MIDSSVIELMVAAMEKRAAEPVANIRTLEPVLVGSLGAAWPYLARAAVDALERGGYRIMSESEVDDVRQGGYDHGLEHGSSSG